MKILFLIVAVLLLVGCASTPSVTQPARAHLYQPRNLAVQTITTIDQDFYTTLAGCQSVLTGFEQQSTQAKYWSVGMQTVGGILGSIFLPIAVVGNASKIWITFLGSAAGFTNTELSVVKNEALDATAVLMSRASVLAGMQKGLEDYYRARAAIPLSLDQLQVAVDRLKVACISYDIASPNSPPIVAPGP